MIDLTLKIVDILKYDVSKDLIVFIISLMPLLELRGGLVAASLLNVDYLRAGMLCILGNILPIPFILLLLKKIFNVLEKFKLTKKVISYFKNKAFKNKVSIDRYGFFGLVLFVGIPLPGTGAWTGALISSVFEMDAKKSFLAIVLGIMLAFIIMSILSYGIISNIIR